jgi:hypothetical protein
LQEVCLLLWAAEIKTFNISCAHFIDKMIAENHQAPGEKFHTRNPSLLTSGILVEIVAPK